ncbi:endonuclease [Haloarcula californiae tailed virus 2]|uniref:SNase-like protein n=1 Tax=Haloarcula californiae tailed virus 2 TaxID=1273747 RepID=R4THL7_9CAUD|nr:endonuclease [Haloarcula californiae tailed virus 2]AGM11801.1 SNase-like protein [Haloarcula californiae tailed virus 2]
MPDEWVFPAHCTRVVDGDTLDVVCDLGFRCTREVRVRLAHVDTAEIYGTSEGSEEHERGDEQAAFVREWLAEAEGQDGAWPLTLRTEKATGKYGRYIATVERPDGEVLHEALLERWPEVASEG